MAGEVAEQVTPQIAGHADERVVGDPACKPPKEIVGRDQPAEQGERDPDNGRLLIGQDVDQELDAILGADRTSDRGQHGAEDDAVGYGSLPDITKNEGKRAAGVVTQIGHAFTNSFIHGDLHGDALPVRRNNAENPESYPAVGDNFF
jgi:hypothetical protein